MVKLHQEFYPETTPPDKRVWEDPDPKIKWALDILEPPGGEQMTLMSRIAMPFIGGFGGFVGILGHNYFRRIPLRSNIFGYVALTALGVLIGEKATDYSRQQRALEIAMVKHYIMLHPDRFPEPEKMKIGDKKVFYSWPIMRKGQA